ERGVTTGRVRVPGGIAQERKITDSRIASAAGVFPERLNAGSGVGYCFCFIIEGLISDGRIPACFIIVERLAADGRIIGTAYTINGIVFVERLVSDGCVVGAGRVV